MSHSYAIMSTMMGRILALLLAVAGFALPQAAMAELATGVRAPQFTTQGALAGKVLPIDLSAALRRGPVVLYFYPKAFTQGCTLEARAFAEAMPEFEKAGASVIGMSADDLPTLKRFSTEECRDRFTVGVATPPIIRAYDVAMKRDGLPANMTSRTSYVIAADGRIAFVHSDLDYRDHVRLTLQAVRALSRKAS